MSRNQAFQGGTRNIFYRSFLNTPLPDETARELELYMDRVNYTLAKISCGCLFLLNLLWWPTDALIFRTGYDAIFYWRVVLTISLPVFGLLLHLGHRHQISSKALLFPGFCYFIAVSMVAMGAVGGPDLPYPHGFYALPPFTAILLLKMRERAYFLLLMSAAFLLAYFGPHPEYLQYSSAGVLLGFMVFLNVLSFVGGNVSYALVRTNFIQEKALKASMEETERLAEGFRQLATVDPLTGIYNRRYLYELAGPLLERYHQENVPFCVAIIDLDHFKRVNDTHGHDAGDKALVHFVETCRLHIRDQDLFGRIGGEEFVLLITEANSTIARVVAERLRRVVAATPFTYAETEIPLTASIGISEVQPDDRVIDDVTKRADDALYAAKDRGRNRIILADDPITVAVEARSSAQG